MDKVKKHTIRVRYVILSVIGFVLAVIIGIVTIALVSYKKQPKLTDGEKQELDNTDLLKRQTSPERAKIIEDNNDALKERIRMISQAKEEIILSTFDFRSDDSGKLILGALIDAADRGVSVNVIVDGVSGFLRMRGNAYFEALAAMPEATVKIYNKVNPLKSYKSMGRLHDKYIVIDRQNYILGGRNTFNYFLGDNEGHKNYDRDVLVYCAKTDENSSVNQLIDYYDSVWNYKESKTLLSSSKTSYKEKIAAKDKVKTAKDELLAGYEAYCADNQEFVDNTDYASETVEVNSIALLSNPIDYEVKKPVVWYQLVRLMKSADSKVKIHTPYIICNDYMYEGLTEICDKVENVSLMTNSIGNNGNPFGSADYYVNKDKILNTGLEVWEYEGGYSYHGKSILIDDNISVIGSFNVDMRSVYLDTELMLVIDSREINSQLNEAMESYEHIARKADADGSYDNPYDVEPVELTPYREKRMKLIKNFILWTRYLF